jgi:mRNA interferase MazF
MRRQVTGSTEPRRGEVWLVAYGAGRAGEPQKHRPGLVLSVDQLVGGSRFDLYVTVPLSTSLRPSPVRPSIAAGEGAERDSVAVCRAIRGMARSRLERRLGQVTAATLTQVERAVAIILGLS